MAIPSEHRVPRRDIPARHRIEQPARHGDVPVPDIAADHGVPRHGVPLEHSIEQPASVEHAAEAGVARQQDGAGAHVPSGDGVGEGSGVLEHSAVAVGGDHGVPGEHAAVWHGVEHLPGFPQAAEAGKLLDTVAARALVQHPAGAPRRETRRGCSGGREVAAEEQVARHGHGLAPFGGENHQ